MTSVGRMSNAAEYQAALVARTKEKVEEGLRVAQRSRLQFRNITGLAIYLSDAVGQSSGNLRRNAAYRSLLEDFLANQRGAAEFISDLATSNPAVLKAKVSKLRLESSNLKRRIWRLEKYIEKKHLKLPTPNELRALTPPEHDTGIDYRMAFEGTAAVLEEVIRRAGFISVDLDKRLIIDKSARLSDQEVAGPTRARWFVMWLSHSRRGA